MNIAPVSHPIKELPSEAEYPTIHLLLLVTGSVAAVKLGLLLDQLSTERCKIRIAATKAAFHFLRRAQPSQTGIPFQSIFTDEMEWNQWEGMSDAVVHIELRRWADLVVIVPLNANTLAKIANGLCDNLVSSVMRAWEVQQKPVIICPAMNTAMWTHPITAKQIGQLEEWYMDAAAVAAVRQRSATSVQSFDDEKETLHVAEPVASPTSVSHVEPLQRASPALPPSLAESMFQVVGPICKRLACGDIGVGGMASVETLAQHMRHTMNLIREEKKRKQQEFVAQPRPPNDETVDEN